MGTWLKPKKKYVVSHEFDDMDTILEGILVSEHPSSMKRQLLKKIVEKGQQAQAPCVVQSVLTISSKWFLHGSDELAIVAGWELFHTWAKNNLSVLDNFFNRDYLVSLLTDKFRNEGNAPLLMHVCMRLVTNITFEKIVQAKAINFVENHTSAVCLKNFIIFLEEYKSCVPKGDFTLKFCECLITSLSKGQPPESQSDIAQYVRDINRVVQFIHQIWQTSDGTTILECLKTIFCILSDTNATVEPSNCLGSLVTCVPNEVSIAVIKQAVKNKLVDNDAMTIALQRMIDWLTWPASVNVDEIVIMFFKELAASNKYSILITVIENKIEQVMEKLQYPPVRHASFNILSHMLYSFQQSALPFHKIVDQVPEMIGLLKKENSKESLECLSKLVEMLHCLMSHHTGFPDLYEPLIELLKPYPKPSAETIQMKLSENKWGVQSTSKISDHIVDVQKSNTGKIGLLNLGNTCYMNSILQALYMCDDFRCNVLSSPVNPGCNDLLSKLQQVFAFLSVSQRPAFAPSSFLETSRPPWFTNGCQQDCSEFLKYLLDQMHEQEKKNTKQSKSIIEDTFGGKVGSTYRCLNCKHESTQVENFIDIPLAFPHHSTSSKALAGGNAETSILTVTSEKEEKLDMKPGENSYNTSLHLNDLITHYLQTEKLTGDNKYHCDRCKGLQEGERTIRIEQSPKYLVLTLLRFSYDVKLQCRSKVFREVKYPETLVLPVNSSSSTSASEQTSKRMKPNDVPSDIYKKLMDTPTSKLGSEKDIYGLCSVIVHSGVSSECGHYYCYSRHSNPSQPDSAESVGNPDEIDFFENKWFLFNDSRVSYTSYDSFSNVTKRFNRDTAYVLVYRKINPAELDGSEASSVDPTISPKLRNDIDKDNVAYLQEQESAAKLASGRRERTSSTSSYYNYKDSDQDDEPPNSCGGGGNLGDLDTSGARFVF